jgi:4-diphosphocytidyl-2-C-methyl-D-erythritol kinase
MKIGVEIGADVPFFFKGGAAIGSGIGERLRQITLPKFWFILIYPNFEVSTRWAYQNFKFPILNAQTSDVEERMRKERSGANLIISHRFSSGVEGLTKRQFHINLHKFLYTPKRISRLLWNDLEGIVSKKYPQINAMKKMLYAVGAVGALMTGSGPTVFGIFPDKRESLEAYKRVKKMVGGRGWLILNTHSISA